MDNEYHGSCAGAEMAPITSSLEDEGLAQLVSIFPDHPLNTLVDALRRAGHDVQLAVTAVLDPTSADPSVSTLLSTPDISNVPTNSKPQPRKNAQKKTLLDFFSPYPLTSLSRARSTSTTSRSSQPPREVSFDSVEKAQTDDQLLGDEVSVCSSANFYFNDDDYEDEFIEFQYFNDDDLVEENPAESHGQGFDFADSEKLQSSTDHEDTVESLAHARNLGMESHEDKAVQAEADLANANSRQSSDEKSVSKSAFDMLRWSDSSDPAKKQSKKKQPPKHSQQHPPKRLGSINDIRANLPCDLILDFLPQELSNMLLQRMLTEAQTWKTRRFVLFEREVQSPHTSCMYAEEEETSRQASSVTQQTSTSDQRPPSSLLPSDTTRQKKYVYQNGSGMTMTYGGRPVEGTRPFFKEMKEAKVLIEEAVNEVLEKRRQRWERWEARQKMRREREQVRATVKTPILNSEQTLEQTLRENDGGKSVVGSSAGVLYDDSGASQFDDEGYLMNPAWAPHSLEISGRWKPNFAAANCYLHGDEAVGAHSDKLTYIGPRPIIGSLTLGACRTFRIRRLAEPTGLPGQTFNINLPHNSLLVMLPPLQEHYRHEVPKQPHNPVAPSITSLSSSTISSSSPPKKASTATLTNATKVPTIPAVIPHPIAGYTRINLTFRMVRQEYARNVPRCRCGNVAEMKPVFRSKAGMGKV
ncbi:hypothetical protein HK102_004573 [Quaeritorhiza haematococci]|nr:hypothetical protein HK102_004573 [Quaeritorhiza haematococci]